MNRTGVTDGTSTNKGKPYPPTLAGITEIISVIFVNYVSTAVGVVLSLVGVTASVINIIIYWRQGITESVNITFISLSLWNLLTCCMACLSEICKTIETLEPLQSVNMMLVQIVYLSYTRGFLYILTTFVTVYLSLERCMCIIIPFKVKDIFTTPRVILANLIIVLFGVACFSPGWATQGINLVFDLDTNKTRSELWVSVNRSGIEDFIDILIGIAMPILAQIIIAVSTACMLQGINKSKTFRQKYAKQEESAKENHKEQIFLAHVRSNSDKRRKVMTRKEGKLTLVVVFLALVFLVCNLPMFTISCLKVFVPEVIVETQHYIKFTLVYNMIFWSRVVNCVVNMLVYYKVSLRYRKEFLSLFTSLG